MKNKALTITLIALLAAVIGLAYLLYNSFSDDYVESEIESESESTVSETVKQSESQPNITSADTEKTSSADIQTEKTITETEKTTVNENIIKTDDFTVTDIDGNSVNLSDYFGKPIVVNFWASWCPPCKQELPDFQTKYDEYGDEVQFLMVNMTDGYSETIEDATKHFTNNKYTMPLFFDTDMDAADTYKVYSIPTTIFIDKDGSLVDTKIGMLSESQLEKAISSIIK